MEANVFASLCPKSTFLLNMPFSRRFLPLSSSSSSSSRHFKPIQLQALGADDSADDNLVDPKPEKEYIVEYRYRRGARKRDTQVKQENPKPKPPPKEWASMTLAEKATELYVGEKGILFWLNKFAYASIFIVIGGWILFRFVGPSLGIYQLDAPPAAPLK